MAGQILVDDKSILREGGWYINNLGYVARDRQSNNVRKRELLHRVIMNAEEGQMIDHINGNKLDNRKQNLRFCDKSQNAANSFIRKQRGRSGYRGVQWNSQTGKWMVRLFAQGERIYGGVFNNIKDAVKKRDELYKKHHGEFARLED